MKDAAIHQFGISAIFALACAFLLGYRVFRPNSRPGVTLPFALLCGLVSVSFARSAFGVGGTERVQVLAWAPIGFAVCFGWSLLSLKQARCLVTSEIGARTRALLRACPHILGTAFLLSLSLGLIWPTPAMEFGTAAPIHHLPYKLAILLPEIFCVSVSAYAFLKAAGPAAKVGRIRLQNFFFFLGSSFLDLVGFEATADAFVRVFGLPKTRTAWDSVADPAELALTVLFVGCFAVGVLLHHSRKEPDKTIDRFSCWRRYREVLDRELWSLAGSGCNGHARALAYLSCAADELRQRAEEDGREARDGGGWGAGDLQKALNAFRLLVLLKSKKDVLLDRMHPDELVFALLRYHNYLLKNSKTSDMRWHIATEGTERRTYSLRSDPLLEPLSKVSSLVVDELDHSKLDLVGEPQWLQLVALVATDVGLLSETQARTIRSKDVVKRRVKNAYEHARLQAQMRTFQSPSASNK